ncbi:hypothetical protein BB559_001784 [Furculomyces boomerangus]|uniref:Large ribosomal subunit protein uL15/eL18 domain-containing protein n=2 Tax=Harpellales TaxID=61421 RepID=A0A2T9Z0E8_9FUNG|nr:hypothetical protein BB559_001784 [Furculomyces boomerangus]PWA02911.1 hypothetical protein BB558_000949 [Smittium angustum]
MNRFVRQINLKHIYSQNHRFCQIQSPKPILFATRLYSNYIVQPSSYNISLNNLRDNHGSKPKKTRLGRGPGSGKGKTSGRGHKGQNARTGNGNTTPGFEGGQTPLFQRYPKRGFTNIFRRELTGLNLDKLQHWIDLGRIDPTKPITLKQLFDSNLVKFKDGVTLLGGGSIYFKTPINIEVTKASKSAIKRIEELGGSITCTYHNKLALRAILKPEKFGIIPKFANPTNHKLLQWYQNPENRGYLSKN